jgi:F-type H+-transporting ATPase subunit gamma
MPSLKDFRTRIASVKSTRKITSAMKMVAASKLRRAQLQAEASRPYAKKMAEMLSRLVSNVTVNSESPFLLGGTGKDQIYLVVVVTSDRGLAGGFNAFVTRLARQRIRQLTDQGKTVKIVTVGRKGRESLRRDHPDKIVHSFEGIGRKRLAFAETRQITDLVLDLGLRGEFDVCEVIYNQFRSVVKQDPTVQQIIPLPLDASAKSAEEGGLKAVYEFEPDEEALLATLLPRNLSIQIFKTLLDSAAGEQAARMQAMDNATRNAGDMIAKLTLRYNRARQAYITKELIEIISGAEAV